jgi:hypothetical protein
MRVSSSGGSKASKLVFAEWLRPLTLLVVLLAAVAVFVVLEVGLSSLTLCSGL